MVVVLGSLKAKYENSAFSAKLAPWLFVFCCELSEVLVQLQLFFSSNAEMRQNEIISPLAHTVCLRNISISFLNTQLILAAKSKGFNWHHVNHHMSTKTEGLKTETNPKRSVPMASVSTTCWSVDLLGHIPSRFHCSSAQFIFTTWPSAYSSSRPKFKLTIRIYRKKSLSNSRIFFPPQNYKT